MLRLLTVAAALCAASPDGELADIRQTLERRGWNDRIHAVHRLEPFGARGLPHLEYAAQDADWQVRLTAVHFMGRAGPAALDSLAAVLKEEPCRHVRLSAVHWLGSFGAPAAAALSAALDDESRLVRLGSRYWLGKNAGAAVSPGEGEAVIAAHEDAKLCAGSYAPHRAPWAAPARAGESEEAEPQAAAAENPDESPAPPPPLPAARQKELESLLSGEPEDLPGAPGLPARETTSGTAAPHETPERAARNGALNAPLGAPESMPPGKPGLARPAKEAPEAALMADAGSPKPEHDPIPALLMALKSRDPKTRARAADELGKRGSDAAQAVEPLTAALSDKSRAVRASAALALGKLGPAAEKTVPRLIRLLKDPHPDVQDSAAAALGRMNMPAARRAFRKHLRAQAAASP